MPTYIYRSIQYPSLTQEVQQSIKEDAAKKLLFDTSTIPERLLAEIVERLKHGPTPEVLRFKEGKSFVSLDVERVIQPPSFVLKGEGFYKTDYGPKPKEEE